MLMQTQTKNNQQQPSRHAAESKPMTDSDRHQARCCHDVTATAGCCDDTVAFAESGAGTAQIASAMHHGRA
jgi:hypothetical protein